MITRASGAFREGSGWANAGESNLLIILVGFEDVGEEGADLLHGTGAGKFASQPRSRRSQQADASRMSWFFFRVMLAALPIIISRPAKLRLSSFNDPPHALGPGQVHSLAGPSRRANGDGRVPSGRCVVLSPVD